MSTTDLFHWSDDFSINIQEIDEQHRVLVDLLNQLHEAIRGHRGKATSREILDRLAEYTRTHFLLEESLMRLTHYPGFEIHKAQHEELIAQVVALQDKLDNENATITFELLHFLKTWLTQHINDSDKRFGAHFQKAGLQKYTAWTEEVDATMKKKKWWWKFW
ncbi:MAG: hemerythrin family protein [Rhodocyclales bacterium]|nr:hemerythrin family protein [Rhodocyclales bacterium]